MRTILRSLRKILGHTPTGGPRLMASQHGSQPSVAPQQRAASHNAAAPAKPLNPFELAFDDDYSAVFYTNRSPEDPDDAAITASR